jgi:rhamnosyltransferase
MKDSTRDRLTSGDDVCAIVVTYHPDAELPTRLSRILEQVHRLIIVDNGSGKPEIEMLRDFARDPRIALALNVDNLGVACALNIGIERALELGYVWALLLDQDSGGDRDMVQTLIQVHAAYPEPDRLAVIGSGFRDVDEAGRMSTDEGHGEGWDERESVITSGSLIPLRTHALIGPFREEFFIDYVDTESKRESRSCRMLLAPSLDTTGFGCISGPSTIQQIGATTSLETTP